MAYSKMCAWQTRIGRDVTVPTMHDIIYVSFRATVGYRIMLHFNPCRRENILSSPPGKYIHSGGGNLWNMKSSLLLHSLLDLGFFLCLEYS